VIDVQRCAILSDKETRGNCVHSVCAPSTIG
jgi:hypothetical protein